MFLWLGIHHHLEVTRVVRRQRYQSDYRMPVQPSSRGAQSSPVVNETSVVVAQHCPAVFVASRVPRLFFFSREGVFSGQAFSTQVEEHHLIHGLVPGLPLGAAVSIIYCFFR